MTQVGAVSVSSHSSAVKRGFLIVTGSTGFLGRALAAALERAGQAALLLDRANSDAGLAKVLAEISEDDRAQAVLVHLAGLADARVAEEEPVKAIEGMIGLTAQTVEACVQFGLLKCVLISSGLVYGKQERQPVSETAPLNPLGVYAGAKAAAEMLARGLASRARLALDIVRPSNVIGPGMRRGTVLGDLIQQLQERRERTVLESLTPRRDYVHVRDVAEALLAVAKLPPVDGSIRVFNVGTGIGTSVADLYRLVAEAMRRTPTEPLVLPHGGGRAFDLFLDASALRAATGWSPRVKVRQAVEELVHGA